MLYLKSYRAFVALDVREVGVSICRPRKADSIGLSWGQMSFVLDPPEFSTPHSRYDP